MTPEILKQVEDYAKNNYRQSILKQTNIEPQNIKT